MSASYVPDVSMFPYWTQAELHKQYKKKINTLIEQKQELEAKVDEAKVIYQENVKYSSEFEAIRRSIEEQCEAAGIMEVMNMRIEEAEKNAREQELFKFIAETDLKKEQEKCKKFVNDYMKLRSVLYNQCDLDECSNCSCWVNENEMEEVKDNDWDDVRVCFECRDNNFTECDCCREYVDNWNIVKNEQTGQELCDNCNSDDDVIILNSDDEIINE